MIAFDLGEKKHVTIEVVSRKNEEFAILEAVKLDKGKRSRELFWCDIVANDFEASIPLLFWSWFH